MKRNEACRLLTSLATNEFIDKAIGKEILKARDIVVCEPNKILDVMATDEERRKYLRILEIYINKITGTLLLDKDVEKKLIEISACIHQGDEFYQFEEQCNGYLPFRCNNCPLYKGMSEDVKTTVERI